MGIRRWLVVLAVWAWVLVPALPAHAAGGPPPVQGDPDLLTLFDTQDGQALDVDVDLTVAAHRLPLRAMVASLGQFTACTLAFAVRSRVARMTMLLPALRRAMAFQLKDSPMVKHRVELTEKEVGHNPTLADALAAARKHRVGYLMMAAITEGGLDPSVSVRLFHVSTGKEVKNRDVSGVLVLQSGPDVMRRLAALRPAGAKATRLAVRDAQLPFDLALDLTERPNEARVVGVAVVAEDAALESMVVPVQRAAMKQLQAHKGVRQVEPLASSLVLAVPDDALGSLAAREELDALVAIRLRPSAEDPQWVETHVLSASAGVAPRLALMSRRVVVRTLESSSDLAVQEFRRQAVKASVVAYVTVDHAYKAVVVRRDEAVLLDSQGNLLTPEQVRRLPLPAAQKAVQSGAPVARRAPEVLPSWPGWVLLAAGPLVGAAFFGVLVGVASGGGAYGASDNAVTAVAGGVVGFVLGAVAGAVAGVLAGFMAMVAYGTVQGAARAMNAPMTPQPKARTVADAERTARAANLVFLEKTGADAVMLDADHFPRDPAAP